MYNQCMSKKSSLNIKSDYFRLISKAVFTNPFDKKRKEILKKVLGSKVKKGENLQ